MIQYYSLDWSLGLSLGWAAMASYFWSGPVFLMYFFIFIYNPCLLSKLSCNFFYNLRKR